MLTVLDEFSRQYLGGQVTVQLAQQSPEVLARYLVPAICKWTIDSTVWL
jgi:hypothetical protein